VIATYTNKHLNILLYPLFLREYEIIMFGIHLLSSFMFEICWDNFKLQLTFSWAACSLQMPLAELLWCDFAPSVWKEKKIISMKWIPFNRQIFTFHKILKTSLCFIVPIWFISGKTIFSRPWCFLNGKIMKEYVRYWFIYVSQIFYRFISNKFGRISYTLTLNRYIIVIRCILYIAYLPC
jgi:hypothetical protein